MVEDRARVGRQAVLVARKRRFHPAGIAGAQRDERLLLRRGKQFGLLARVGGEGIERCGSVRLGELLRWLELAAIEIERLIERVGREMARKGVWQAEHRRELRAEQARSQYPQRHIHSFTRHRANAEAVVAREKGLQFEDILRKLPFVAGKVATQRMGNPLVRPRRAAEAEIDAARKQRLQRPELLGDHHRRMVGQHDAARADTNARCRLPDVREHDRCRRARDPRHAVMLGHPIAVIAESLGVAGEIGGVGERPGDRAGIGDGHEVEEREFRHETDMRLPGTAFNHHSSFPLSRE